MKKLLALLLTFALIVSFAACGNKDTSSGNDKTISSNNVSNKTPDATASDVSSDTLSFENPPKLIVSCGENSVNARLDKYDWSYTNTQTGIVKSINRNVSQQLKALDETKTLQIAPTAASSIEPPLASLQFSIAPDKIDVKCYYFNEEGQYKSEAVSVEGMTFKTKEGSCLYEISARWTSSNVYSGEAYYAFKTVKPDLEIVDPNQNNPSSNITPNPPKDAASLIGKTVGDVKAAFGNNFKFGYYSGARCMEYTDAKIIFILVNSLYEDPADSCKIRKIISRGDILLIDNLNCNLTYTDLVAQLGTSVITEEPKYWFSDMGGDYEYTLIFNYKGYRIDFYWANEDPKTHKPQYINVMLPDDPYFRP